MIAWNSDTFSLIFGFVWIGLVAMICDESMTCMRKG